MVFILCSVSVSGQIIKGTVIAGGNLTQVEGDETKGWRQFGFNGGLGAIIPFGKDQKWGFNIEALFSQKGSYQRAQFEDSITNEYRLRLNYFEVPVYFTYTDKDIISAGLGAYYGRLVSYREIDRRGQDYPYDEFPEFRDWDVGFVIDARVRIWKHLHFNVRYSQTIGFIRSITFYPTGGDPIERKQLNQSIGLRFIYIFNEGSRATGPPE
jgi:hypothetical protein